MDLVTIATVYDDRIVIIKGTTDAGHIRLQCGAKTKLGWVDLSPDQAKILANSLLAVAEPLIKT